MTNSVEADREVAFAIMQEATERLLDFMGPVDAAKCIAAFGIMSTVELAGYDATKELMMVATTEALKAQARRGLLGPS